MKEVKINNYIDNRIMLSTHNRKKSTDAIAQQQQQPNKPIVIHNLNYFNSE
jgi:hypothetical protein